MHSPWTEIVLGVVVCVMLAPYALAPLQVSSLLKFKIPPEVIEIDPQQDQLPESIRKYFYEAYEALTRNGFDLVGTIILPRFLPNVKSVFALYANRATGDQAMSTLILATGGIEMLKDRYVEFITRYSDGVMVQTNNSAELGALKLLPQEHTTKFWEIQDLDLLYKLHRFLAQKYRRSGKPVCKLDAEYNGNAIGYVCGAVIQETLAAQVETGYLAAVPGGFKATKKGACIMGWQELWPMKAIRRARCRREAEQALVEFHSQGRRF